MIDIDITAVCLSHVVRGGGPVPAGLLDGAIPAVGVDWVVASMKQGHPLPESAYLHPGPGQPGLPGQDPQQQLDQTDQAADMSSSVNLSLFNTEYSQLASNTFSEHDLLAQYSSSLF